MKHIIKISLASLVLLSAALTGRAWTYADGDALLIFRDGTHDVEFDLGNVSQFTGLTSGQTKVVTNWSFNLVTNTFGADLTTNGDGVTVLLVAATTTNAWLSSVDPNTTAYNPGAAGLGSIYGLVSSVGLRPITYTVPTNTTLQSYVIGVSGSGNAGKYKYASYDYIVSGGTYNAITKLGGVAPFVDEENIPGSLDLWSIQSSSSTPQPPDNLVGTFSFTANGVLTFVAGPRPSNIANATRLGTISTVSFSTTVGNTYTLAYTNKLGGAPATWPVDTTTLTGDGTVKSLNHTNSATTEFYRVIAH